MAKQKTWDLTKLPRNADGSVNLSQLHTLYKPRMRKRQPPASFERKGGDGAS